MPRLNLAGGAYQLDNIDIEYQRCINFYPILDQKKRFFQALILTPGREELLNYGLSECRAIIYYKNRIFAVVENEFIELFYEPRSKTLTSEFIDTLVSSEGIIKFATNDTQIMIVDGDNYYIFVESSNDFLTNVSSNFKGADSVVNIDGYFFFNEPDSSTLWASDLQDGLTISALDFTTANNQSDNVVAVVSNFGELWAIGEKSIQVYSNTAEASGFPFTPRTGATIYKGCIAKNSIVNMENSIVFLNTDYDVVYARGYDLEPLTTTAIKSAISEYEVTSDAIAYSYTKGTGKFYVIIFPTENKCWVYDFNSGAWHERLYYNPITEEYERPLEQVAVDVDGSIIVGGYDNGTFYLLSNTYYTDRGDSIKRIRTLSHLSSDDEYMEVPQLKLIASTGEGTASIIMRYSIDRGHTWSSDLSRDMGDSEDYAKSITWNRLGTQRNFLIEIEYSSAVDTSLKDLFI